MGIFLNGVGANKFKLTVNGTDLTSRTRSVTINQNYDDVDTTAMAADARAHTPGLRDDNIEVEFFQDWDAGSTDAVIRPLLGSSSGGTIVVISGGTAASATTPSFTLVGVPMTYQPVSGGVGDVSVTSVTFVPVIGQSITYGTA